MFKSLLIDRGRDLGVKYRLLERDKVSLLYPLTHSKWSSGGCRTNVYMERGKGRKTHRIIRYQKKISSD